MTHPVPMTRLKISNAALMSPVWTAQQNFLMTEIHLEPTKLPLRVWHIVESLPREWPTSPLQTAVVKWIKGVWHNSLFVVVVGKVIPEHVIRQ